MNILLQLMQHYLQMNHHKFLFHPMDFLLFLYDLLYQFHPYQIHPIRFLKP